MKITKKINKMKLESFFKHQITMVKNMDKKKGNGVLMAGEKVQEDSNIGELKPQQCAGGRKKRYKERVKNWSAEASMVC